MQIYKKYDGSLNEVFWQDSFIHVLNIRFPVRIWVQRYNKGTCESKKESWFKLSFIFHP